MSLKSILYSALLVFSFAAPLSATELKYDIKAYGEQIAVISVSGPGSDTLLVTPSDSGRIITIAGPSLKFIPLRTAPLPTMIKGVRSLSNGANTELIMEFASPTQITATPSSTSLQIRVKVQSGDRRIPATKKIPAVDEIKKLGLTLPSPQDFKGATTLSTSLKVFGTVVDALWAILNGRSFSFKVEKSDSSLGNDQKKVKQLESLVSELNNEIIELRKELRKNNAERESN